MGSLVTTTTLAALKANNTSAYSGYVWNNADAHPLNNRTIASNFDPAEPLWDKSLNLSPTNVSKENLSTACGVPAYFLWMPWWNRNSYDHINVGYSSTDAAKCAAQVADMQSRGGGLIIDFYNYSAEAVMRDAAQAAGVTQFVMIDGNASTLYGTSGTTCRNALLTIYQNIAQNYMTKSTYLKIGGRPVLMDYALGGDARMTASDWTYIRANLYDNGQGSANPIWLSDFWKTAHGTNQGNYAWIESDDADLSWFYEQVVNNPGQYWMGSVRKGFHDKLTCPDSATLGNWCGGAVRHLAQNNGQTWQDGVTSAYNNRSRLIGVIVPTWNDYEEGAAVEMGVGAGTALGVSPSITGNTVTWTTSGNSNCIKKYRVWASLDGVNVGQVGGDITGASFDLSTSGIDAPGNYRIYVQAITTSCVQTAISDYVTWGVSYGGAGSGGSSLRNLTSDMLTALDSDKLCPCILVEISFVSGTVYLWNGLGTLTWNSHDWQGVGSLGTISEMVEGTEVKAHGITLSLSGVVPLDEVLTECRQGRPVIVRVGLFDNASGVLIADPGEAWRGRMDVPGVNDDPLNPMASITVESRLISLKRGQPRRYTDQDQKINYPTDRGFEYVNELQEKNIVWGKGTPIPSGMPSGFEGCVELGTEVIVPDGTTQEILPCNEWTVLSFNNEKPVLCVHPDTLIKVRRDCISHVWKRAAEISPEDWVALGDGLWRQGFTARYEQRDGLKVRRTCPGGEYLAKCGDAWIVVHNAKKLVDRG